MITFEYTIDERFDEADPTNKGPWLCMDAVREVFKFPPSVTKFWLEARLSTRDPEDVEVSYEQGFYNPSVTTLHLEGHCTGTRTEHLKPLIGTRTTGTFYVTMHYEA